MATRRVAKVDIELGGKVSTSFTAVSPCLPASWIDLSFLTPIQTIKAGEGIIAATQSGNRDAEVFPDPDTFNMYRKRGAESAFGFGYGEHRCVAEWLARAELEIVFSKCQQMIHQLTLNVPDLNNFNCSHIV